ncbi:MAG: DUF3035 domain-containing protein, partial [Amylibacter sp.]|nr:DUF3035 domain-containing protein [Amylibacter sp.]
MFVRILKLIVPLSLIIVLAGCGENPVFGKNGNFRLKDAGPDEFAVLPTKELVMPEDYASLPEPTLGSKNRADVEPQRDAVAVLGGKPEQLDSDFIGAGEQPLIAAASRFGVTSDIRTVLAEEDKTYRKKHKAKFYDRWIYSDDAYLRRLKNQALEPYDELPKLRAQGIR